MQEVEEGHGRGEAEEELEEGEERCEMAVTGEKEGTSKVVGHTRVLSRLETHGGIYGSMIVPLDPTGAASGHALRHHGAQAENRFCVIFKGGRFFDTSANNM